jgi:hypothetical protein
MVINITGRWPKAGNSASSGRTARLRRNDSLTWRNLILLR